MPATQTAAVLTRFEKTTRRSAIVVRWIASSSALPAALAADMASHFACARESASLSGKSRSDGITYASGKTRALALAALAAYIADRAPPVAVEEEITYTCGIDPDMDGEDFLALLAAVQAEGLAERAAA